MVRSVAEEAHELVNGQRRDDYGGVLESHIRIGKLWAPILGLEEVTPEQVALCMIEVKVSRYLVGGTRDSLVDICGYAECIEMMENERDSQ